MIMINSYVCTFVCQANISIFGFCRVSFILFDCKKYIEKMFFNTVLLYKKKVIWWFWSFCALGKEGINDWDFCDKQTSGGKVLPSLDMFFGKGVSFVSFQFTPYSMMVILVPFEKADENGGRGEREILRNREESKLLPFPLLFIRPPSKQETECRNRLGQSSVVKHEKTEWREEEKRPFFWIAKDPPFHFTFLVFREGNQCLLPNQRKLRRRHKHVGGHKQSWYLGTFLCGVSNPKFACFSTKLWLSGMEFEFTISQQTCFESKLCLQKLFVFV